MNIYTSYYGNLRKLMSNGIIPVGISIGIPKYFTGYSLQYLAPTYQMLHLSEEEYIPKFKEILKKVDIKKVLDDLKIISENDGGRDVALLCYEKPGDFCHRRLVADWIKEKTGYEVEEYGWSQKKNPEVIQGTLF